jgi:hypothetical protein
VKEVHIWTNRPVWPQSPHITARPKEGQPVPPNIHWDEWLGPARDEVVGRLEAAGEPLEDHEGEPLARDPAGNALVLSVS